MNRLKPVQQEVIRRSFGLAGTSRETLADIARDRGVSRERIRVIQQKAIRQLRVLVRQRNENPLVKNGAVF